MRNLVGGLAFVCLTAGVYIVMHAQEPPTIPFKVATWNVRSGKGVAAKVNPRIVSTSLDCNLNASKAGGPFWRALDTIKHDPQVVVLGMQEAWACASPSEVRAYLGWEDSTGELDGVAFVSRYGTRGAHVRKQIGFSGTDGLTEDRSTFGGDVCVNASCSQTIRVYVAHLGSGSGGNAGGGTAALNQIANLLTFVHAQPSPTRNVVMGDFNYYNSEPTAAPCGSTTAASPAADVFRSFGYVDVWLALRPRQPGATGMWHRTACGTPQGNLYKRIDYVYTRGVEATAITRFGMVTPWTQDAPSDHAGLIASFNGARPPAVTRPDGARPPAVTPPAAAPNVPRPAPAVAPGRDRIIWAGRQPARIAGAFQTIADAAAAGGRLLYNVSAGRPKVTRPLARPASLAEYHFTAEANRDYHVWLRAKATANSYKNDSVYMQFDRTVDTSGRPAYRIGSTSAIWLGVEHTSGAGLNGFGWNDNGWSGMGRHIRFAASGRQTLRLQPREDGIRIDQIVISPANYLNKSPGLLKNDATILSPERRE